jgi:hypothetical protein
MGLRKLQTSPLLMGRKVERTSALGKGRSCYDHHREGLSGNDATIYYWVAVLALLAVEHVELIDLFWVYRLAELAIDLIDPGELIPIYTPARGLLVTTLLNLSRFMVITTWR